MEESHYYDFNNILKHEHATRSKLDQRIENIARKEGYVTCKVIKKPLSSNGGNYLGALFQINIKGTTDNGEKETNIFVKSIAPDAIAMELLSLSDVYNHELFVYTELTKIFEQLQTEAQIPEDEKFKTVKSYDESYNEAIILENVAKRGFTTWYRMDVITIEIAEIFVKQLARFHGLSIAMENKRPEYYEKKIKSMRFPLQSEGRAWVDFCDKSSKVAIDLLDEELKRRVGHKIPGLLERFAQYYEDGTSKYCLCHGDYRPNNIMVKQVDGIITEALPVDYQIIHYGCPIIDFFYLMYSGTDYKFRKSHMASLKDLYFEILRTYLQNYGISVNSILPRSSFEKMYTEKLDYGLMFTILFVPFIFADEENVPDLAKESMVDLDLQLDNRYRDRLIGAVEELIELGYL